MKAREIMQRYPDVVTPDDRVTCAAELMHYSDDAGIPVIRADGDRVLVGIITARDIAVRCVARNHMRECTVAAHMTPMPLQTSGPDDDIVDAARKMAEWEIRRLPVVSADGVLMGVVRESDVRRALRKIETASARLPITARALQSEVMRPLLTNFDRGRDRTILQSSNQEIPLISRMENTHGQPPQTSREVEKAERERSATGGHGAAR